jgi:hypothetical protein
MTAGMSSELYRIEETLDDELCVEGINATGEDRRVGIDSNSGGAGPVGLGCDRRLFLLCGASTLLSDNRDVCSPYKCECQSYSDLQIEFHEHTKIVMSESVYPV